MLISGVNFVEIHSEALVYCTYMYMYIRTYIMHAYIDTGMEMNACMPMYKHNICICMYTCILVEGWGLKDKTVYVHT